MKIRRTIQPAVDEGSLRLRIRTGDLPRSAREDPEAELRRREPDELFEPIIIKIDESPVSAA